MTLDVRTKIILLILANGTFFFRTTGALEAMIIVVLAGLLFLMGKQRLASCYVGLFLVLLGIDHWLLNSLPPFLFRITSLLVIVLCFILPFCLAASILIQTTSAYELVHGLRKWHFPEPILLTIAVIVRFIPMIRQEAIIIHQSLKVRGIFMRKRDMIIHPRIYFEYLLVPLLMALLRASRDLTLATVTKGLVIDKKYTFFYDTALTWKDWGVWGWTFITFIAMILH